MKVKQHKMSNILLLAVAAYFFSCKDKGSDNSMNDTTGGHTADPDENQNIQFDVNWLSDGIQLVINNGDSGRYYFGMAQTDCSIGELCWQGEDCIYGVDSYNDVPGPFSYCHPVDASGPDPDDDLILVYGGDFQDLQEGQETVFSDPSYEPLVTYAVFDTESADCWVWGHDVEYYQNLCAIR